MDYQASRNNRIAGKVVSVNPVCRVEKKCSFCVHRILYPAGSMSDGFVKSRKMYNFVIPVKTGIQFFKVLSPLWIPAYARMTDFLRNCHVCAV